MGFTSDKNCLLLVCMVSRVILVFCSDYDPLQDFCPRDTANKGIFINGFVCKTPSIVNSSDFKSSLLNKAGNTRNRMGSAVTLASAANLPGLNTQGLSFARIDYAKGAIVAPHEHPRASEVLFVSQGTLSVGFVDTNNKLYPQTLSEGDIFVFPKGLVHFILNVGHGPATTFSTFNSQNPGLVNIFKALFTSDAEILEQIIKKAFEISSKQLHHLRDATSKLG